MNDTERSVFWICVILTMAMAFTAMMIVLPRVCDIHSSINFDYQTMIVTILGIFITVLIGWQIWTTIDTRRIIERFDERIRTNEIAVERLQQQFAHVGEIATASNELANAQRIVESITHSPVRANAHEYAEGYQLASTALTRLMGIQDLTNALIERCFSLLNQILTNSHGILDNGLLPNTLKNRLISEFINMNPFVDANRRMVLPQANALQLSQLETLLSLRREIVEHPTFPKN